MDGTLRTNPTLALAMALALAAGVAAQAPTRVRVRIGDRVVYTRVGPGFLPGLGDTNMGLGAPPEELPGAPSTPPADRVAPAPPEPADAGHGPPVAADELVPTNIVDLSEANGETLEDPGPAPAEFRSLLASIYGITDDETIASAWWWASREDADLPFDTRAGNGMHRFMVARLVGEPVAGEYRGEPYPEGTTGNLFTVNGVTVRAAPFGAVTGTLADGETVTILGRDENNWYRIRGSSGVSGWSSGFWMRFR